MDVAVRPLEERDLPAADRIFRLAFGTFLGLPDPVKFAGDTDYAGTRWRADPSGAIGAEIDGQLVGSNFAARWGSFGFFGPLSVRPDLWDKGVARQLLERTMEIFARWGTTHVGLFTFAQSAKHIALYQKFGFSARFLTAVMARTLDGEPRRVQWSRFSELPSSARDACLDACRDLTNALYEGLDVAPEIRSVAQQKLGDTVLVRDERGVAGLAVCHCGPGTEAGSGACYVKFGAARPGAGAAENFARLLDACEDFARVEQLQRLAAGVNMARHEAYRLMVERGYRTFLQGVAMQRPNEEGFNRPGVYALDDWR